MNRDRKLEFKREINGLCCQACYPARPRGAAMQFDRMELCGLCGTPPLSYVDPEAGTAVADDMIGTE
jgi:hypothetical protein